MSLHIQALRGIAVILVIFFHMGFNTFRNGWIGVDIFFVISGFLMWHLYSENLLAGQIKLFFKKRLIRLLPALCVTLLIFDIIFYIKFFHTYRAKISWEAFVATIGMSNIYYWLIDNHSTSGDLRVFIPLWSIALEIQFYISFPIIVSFIKNSMRKLIITFIAVFSIYILLLITLFESKIYTLPGKFSEFLLGVFAAKIIKDLKLSKTRIYYSQILLLILLIIVFNFEFSGKSVIFLQILSSFTATFFILGTFYENKTNLLLKLFEKIGDYSYSLYLIHFPLFILSRNIFEKENSVISNSLTFTLLYICILVLGSILLRNYVEKGKWFRENYVKTYLITLFVTTSLLVTNNL